jgi:electron transport protein HydN
MIHFTPNAFVVADPDKCIGCKVCEVACAVAHLPGEALTAGNLDVPLISRLYLVKTAEVTMPVQCRHCEAAPCAQVCTAGAITQQHGQIVIAEKKCIGCKTCILACPFGAIELVPVYHNGEPLTQNGLKVTNDDGYWEKELLVASKCDLCINRPDGPACVAACPEKALLKIVPRQEKKIRNRNAAKNLLETVRQFTG